MQPQLMHLGRKSNKLVKRLTLRPLHATYMYALHTCTCINTCMNHIHIAKIIKQVWKNGTWSSWIFMLMWWRSPLLTVAYAANEWPTVGLQPMVHSHRFGRCPVISPNINSPILLIILIADCHCWWYSASLQSCTHRQICGVRQRVTALFTLRIQLQMTTWQTIGIYMHS